MHGEIESTRGLILKEFLGLISRACQDDNIELVSEAISFGSSSGSKRSLKEATQMVLGPAISHDAPKILEYVLKHGAEFGNKAAAYIALATYESKFPRTLVQILLDNGWDINYRQRDTPLLWQILYDGEAVAWCLDHGASVLPLGQKSWPTSDINSAKEWREHLRLLSHEEKSDYLQYCPPILEEAASQSTVETFELLRSNGAPLGWRTLHKAAQSACFTRRETPATQQTSRDLVQLSGRERAPTHEERMAMVRHLVDTLKLDVNSRDQPPGFMLGNFFGRPLHYVAYISGSKEDCKEVTLFLLGRGADPKLLDSESGTTPMMLGKQNFRDIVEQWKMTRRRLASAKKSRSLMEMITKQ